MLVCVSLSQYVCHCHCVCVTVIVCASQYVCHGMCHSTCVCSLTLSNSPSPHSLCPALHQVEAYSQRIAEEVEKLNAMETEENKE